MNIALFAYLFAFLALITVLFQFALAAGMPWGNLAMGGRYPGKFPRGMRVGAVGQALLIAFLAMVVLANAGVAFMWLSPLSNVLIWVAVAISVVSLLMNLITPSKWERILWAPVALLMTISSIMIAVF